MITGLDALGPAQSRLVEGWLGAGAVLADHSWGQTDTVVPEVQTRHGRYVVKAGGPTNGHLAREIRGHREWTRPWLATGQVARLVAADEQAQVLVTTWLPGHLVEGTAAQDDPETYRQAGRLIAAFHGRSATVDPGWNDRLRDRALRFLAMPHRIGAALVELVRADLRPPEEDLIRLSRQDFLRDPRLEAAFLEGYGKDPRDPATWRRMNVVEAVGTAARAFDVADQAFEAVGHAHLARLHPA